MILGDDVTTEDGTGIVHIAPTFGADDAFVARAAHPVALHDQQARRNPPDGRPHGKFHLLDELDERFVAECVDVDRYREYAGRWVKNAYDQQFTVDGRYDEQAAQAAESLDIYICMKMKAASQAFRIEKHVHDYPHRRRMDKPVLDYPLDSLHSLDGRQGAHDRAQPHDPLETRVDRHGTLRQVAREPQRLEPLAFALLARPCRSGVTEDRSEMKCIGSVEELMAEIEKAVAAA